MATPNACALPYGRGTRPELRSVTTRTRAGTVQVLEELPPVASGKAVGNDVRFEHVRDLIGRGKPLDEHICYDAGQMLAIEGHRTQIGDHPGRRRDEDLVEPGDLIGMYRNTMDDNILPTTAHPPRYGNTKLMPEWIKQTDPVQDRGAGVRHDAFIWRTPIDLDPRSELKPRCARLQQTRPRGTANPVYPVGNALEAAGFYQPRKIATCYPTLLRLLVVTRPC